MVLDFEKMPATPMEHFKGGEGTLGLRKFDDPAMGAVVRLTMPAGSTIGMHTHVGNCEVVYVLAGSGVCYYERLGDPRCRQCAGRRAERPHGGGRL